MTGLIGWWPLNELSGSARDLSGKKNNGSLNGAVQGVAGKGGVTGYYFDGSSDVTIGNKPSLTGDLTVSMWVRFDSFTSGGWSSSLSRYDSDYNSWILIGAYDGNFAYTAAEGGNGYGIGQTISLETDRWYHLVGTVRDGTVEGWVDGSLIETNSNMPSSGVTHSASMNWAVSNYNGGRRMNGIVSDVRIYDRALSSTEIKTLHDWGNGRYSEAAGTRNGETYTPDNGLAYYSMDGDFTDSWNSYDGSNNGAAFTADSVRGSKSASFDGSSFVNVDSISFSDQNSYTFSTWIRPESQSSYGGILATDMGSSSDNYGLNLRRDSGDRYEFIVSQDTTGVEGPYTLTENSGWYHLVGIYDSSDKRAKLYSNGRKVQDKDVSNASFSTSDGVNIGRYSVDSSTHYYFAGLVDDVRIYSRALSHREVFELYQWGTRGRDMRKFILNARGS